MQSPAEIRQLWINTGVRKAGLPVLRMFILAVMAGAFIGLGAHAFLLATPGNAPDPILAKTIGAALFPAGLLLVILTGSELFTGNNLLALALLDKKITFGGMLRNWCVVYLGNFAGSVLTAFLLAKSGLYSGAALERAAALAASKASMPFGEALVRGIFCNILVVLACFLAAGAKEAAGKFALIFMPIFFFVFAGFEHSVANMTYIPLGMFLGADVSIGGFLLGNLLPVTLGNIIGGAILVPAALHFTLK